MIEERRTTVNLPSAFAPSSSRGVHQIPASSIEPATKSIPPLEAPAIPRKSELKKAVWLDAYERQNVDIGLACGLRGRAQYR